jgi:hypothetical protein
LLTAGLKFSKQNQMIKHQKLMCRWRLGDYGTKQRGGGFTVPPQPLIPRRKLSAGL